MKKKKKLMEEEILTTTYEGTEWCPHCNMETAFTFLPMNNTHIVCKNCGNEIISMFFM